jgi:hypothetical protein
MSDKPVIEGVPNSPSGDEELQSRRDFLIGVGRWSKIAIGAAILGGLAAGQREAVAGAWVNRRGGVVVGGGGAWINNRYGGGGAWVNRRY